MLTSLVTLKPSALDHLPARPNEYADATTRARILNTRGKGHLQELLKAAKDRGAPDARSERL